MVCCLMTLLQASVEIVMRIKAVNKLVSKYALHIKKAIFQKKYNKQQTKNNNQPDNKATPIRTKKANNINVTFKKTTLFQRTDELKE